MMVIGGLLVLRDDRHCKQDRVGGPRNRRCGVLVASVAFHKISLVGELGIYIFNTTVTGFISIRHHTVLLYSFVPMHPHITTGKTATLKAILSLFGLGDQCLQRGKVTAEALLQLSSLSSFPILVDDISSETKMEEITVSYFNAAGHTTLASGTIYCHRTKALWKVIVHLLVDFPSSDFCQSVIHHTSYVFCTQECQQNM